MKRQTWQWSIMRSQKERKKSGYCNNNWGRWTGCEGAGEEQKESEVGFHIVNLTVVPVPKITKTMDIKVEFCLGKLYLRCQWDI